MREAAATYAPDFGKRRVKGLSIQCFARWVQASIQPDQVNALTLPPLQRHSLWRPRQILAFWDSLLRGLPIGMFYLVQRLGEQETVGFNLGAETRVSHHGGFDLVDGQQRTRSLMLAFDDLLSSGKCVWVDLLGAQSDGVPSLRLTTRSQPFGYDAEGAKLRVSDRKVARERYEEQCSRSTDSEELKKLFDHQLFDWEIEKRLWPPSPYFGDQEKSLYVPLHEVMLLLDKAISSNQTGFAEAIADLLRRHGARQPDADVVRSLQAAIKRFNAAEIALLLVDLGSAQGENSDLLLRLFERVGAGGTPLSEPERLYSIYKHHFPRVRDLVEKIERDEGHIMTSTLIANTALRIANVASSEAHEAPSPRDLGALLAGRHDRAERFRCALLDLIPESGDGKVGGVPANGPLHAAFKTVKKALLYCPTQNPNGLPKLMLVELPHELVQVMVYWAVRAKTPDPVASQSEAIRFALFWHLCATSNLQCARSAIRWIRAPACDDIDLSTFPGRDLYRLLTGQMEPPWEYALRLVKPEDMLDFNRPDKRGATWLSYKDRFEHDPTHVAKRLFGMWWNSGGKLLLWLQRQSLEEEFGHYNPLTEHDEDKPIDLDHLQPKAHWAFNANGRTPLAQLTKVECEAFRYGRDQLGNSIGNYRWVGSAQNRGDGDRGLADKMHRARSDDEAWLSETFDPTAFDDWIVADASLGWTSERTGKFQSAVEDRALWLYRRFFEDAGFGEWLDQH